MTGKIKLSHLAIAAAMPLFASTANALEFHGLSTSGDTLVRFDGSGALLNTVGISGLNGDSLADIDVFFSRDQRLYGMGQSGTLYVVDPTTGQAAVDTANAAVGSPVAVDFNPAADRLRIFSAGDANYRLTPGTGVVSNDGTLAFAVGDINENGNPNLRAGAYINNVDNPGATTLFSIDSDLNALIRHSLGPQFSTLNTVAELTLNGAAFDIGEMVGFDVFSPMTGVNSAFLSNGNDLYALNLGDGSLTALGPIGTALNLRSVAVAGMPDGGNLLPGLSAALAGLYFLKNRRGKR